MTTAREQRLQKRKEAATKAGVHDHRMESVRALPEPVKMCLRSLVAFKDSLVCANKNLRDARLKDEVTLKESEDELVEVKHELACQKAANADLWQAFKDPELEVKTLRDPRIEENYTKGMQENEDIRAKNKRLADANLVLLREQVDQDQTIKLLEEGNATLKSLVENLTKGMEEGNATLETLEKQNKLLGSSFEDILNEQKKLLKAVDTAGNLLANASLAQSIVM